MTFLYGDSQPSPLSVNYIEFLQEAIRQSIEIVFAEDRMNAMLSEKEVEAKAGQKLVTSIEGLGTAVVLAMQVHEASEFASELESLRETITQAVKKAVSQQVAHARDTLMKTLEGRLVQYSQERRKVFDAIEALIIAQELPGASGEVHVRLGNDGRYTAEWAAKTDYGVKIQAALAIPAESRFASNDKLTELMAHLEVHAQEMAGWIRKEAKTVSHNLGRLRLHHISASPDMIHISLQPPSDLHAQSYSIVVDRKEGTLGITQLGDEPTPIDANSMDASGFLRFANSLAEDANSLRNQRTKLLAVSIDDVSVTEHDQPSLLVERLMKAVAPVVCEIARHSPEDELVLRRLIGDNRREETFVTKQTLRDRIDKLPEERRGLFAALKLGRSAARGGAAAVSDFDDEATDVPIELISDSVDADIGWEEEPVTVSKQTSMKRPAARVKTGQNRELDVKGPSRE